MTANNYANYHLVSSHGKYSTIMFSAYLQKILNARVYDVAIETPIDEMPNLSSRCHNRILLKREDLQPIFSFKIRGAYNKMVTLSAAQKAKGVLTASAGNHAQGVALAASKLGIHATLVMPKTTPQIKLDAVKSFGPRILLQGDTYDEAAVYARRLAEQKGMIYIHPYDDPAVIAGQGTIGLEILRQHTDSLEAVFVPVGGGGLIAGIAACIKSVRPEIKIIAVEPEDAACLAAAMAKGRRVTLAQVGLFADGVAVAQIGKEPFRIIQQAVDQVMTVTTDEICAAIKDIFEDTRSIAEPAGALALAGLKNYLKTNHLREKTVLAIDSGANSSFDRLRYISERTEIGEKREAILAVTIPERAGSFKRFCQLIGKRMITEFNYRYADKKEAQIFVGVQISPNNNDRQELIMLLHNQGYAVIDMTDNEMAKLHIRHMVGGHAPMISDERVYRFEFPERPGALLKFLTRLGHRWNISMFHYRNHAAAYGRVVVGLQVPPAETGQVEAFLARLNYRYWVETNNPAYRLFLG